jgi:hypothetical protein
MKLASIDVDALPDWDRQVLILADSDAKEDKVARWLLWFSIGALLAWMTTEWMPWLEIWRYGFMILGITGLSSREVFRERAAWIRITRRLDAAGSVDGASR